MQAVQAGGVQQGSPEPIRRRISGFLARSVSRFRVVLLVILVAAAAFLVGYFIYFEVSHSRATTSAAMAERLQTQFDNWSAEADTAKKAALEKDLFTQAGAIISRYPRQYGGERALFIRAEASYTNKDWDAAAKDYQALAAGFPKSYLAPISLFDAGVCLEEKGQTDAALAMYLKASSDYKDSPVAPRALFDAGRVYEAKSDWANAQKTYTSMDETYGQSMWTRLAKNRLVELKVLGKIK